MLMLMKLFSLSQLYAPKKELFKHAMHLYTGLSWSHSTR